MTRKESLSVDKFKEYSAAIESEVGKVIVGQTDVIRLVLTSILAGGHMLLEGVPGLGKTMLIRTLGDVLKLEFSRIQFTPDLMPADIVGTEILIDQDGQREFRFKPGPIFANLVLADEINRATPKTQSALLEAMHRALRNRRRTNLPAHRTFLCDGHPKPVRNGRHLPATGSSAGSVSVQDQHLLSFGWRIGENLKPHDRRRWSLGKQRPQRR